MNLLYKNLKALFFITLILTLLIPSTFPSARLYFFIPFIITSYYQKPLLTCLWYSIACGLVLDLLAADSRLGLHAVVYSLSTMLLYGQRKNFFSDYLTTLPLMTLFFSLLATTIETGIYYGIGKAPPLTLNLFICDFVVMPICDAAYAFTFFILPYLVLGKKQLKGKDYFISENG
ncbi:MAG: mreD [Chlamydiota bacterium]|nr:mreD [Chlamydiota bacterium]